MTAQFTTIAAQIFVADIVAASEFYVASLGFAVDFTYGEPPYYAQVTRGAAHITLRRICEPVFAGDIREREELLSASIMVATKAEIETLFAEFASAAVAFRQPLQAKPWGALDFIVRDPDGNLLLFAGPGK